MTGVIAMDDLAPMRLVTVERISAEIRAFDDNPAPPQPPQFFPRPGVPMRVLAVSLPYVLCEVPMKNQPAMPIPFDARTTRFRRVSRGYFNAFHRAYGASGSKAQEIAETQASSPF